MVIRITLQANHGFRFCSFVIVTQSQQKDNTSPAGLCCNVNHTWFYKVMDYTSTQFYKSFNYTMSSPWWNLACTGQYKSYYSFPL